MVRHESNQTQGRREQVRHQKWMRRTAGLVTVAALSAMGGGVGADDISPSQYGRTMGAVQWQATDSTYPGVQALGPGVTATDAEMIVRGSPKVVVIADSVNGTPLEEDCGGLAIRDRDGRPQLYTAGHCVDANHDGDETVLRREDMANVRSVSVVPYPGTEGADMFNISGDAITVRNTAPQNTPQTYAPAVDDSVRLVMADGYLNLGFGYELPPVNTAGLQAGDTVAVFPPQTEKTNGMIHTGTVEGAAPFEHGWMIVVDFNEATCPKGASGTGVFKLIPGAEPGAIGVISGYTHTDAAGNPIEVGRRCVLATTSIDGEIGRVFSGQKLSLQPNQVVAA